MLRHVIIHCDLHIHRREGGGVPGAGEDNLGLTGVECPRWHQVTSLRCEQVPKYTERPLLVS
jgi:hypothetical protein